MEAAQAVSVTEPTPELSTEDTQQTSGSQDETQVNGKTAAPPPKKDTRKAKINGKEVDVDVDTLVRDYQKYMAGDERLRSASDKEKALEKWLESAKADPWQILEQLGLNPDEAAEARLLKKLEYDMLSPDARKARDLEKEMAKIKGQLQAAEEEKKKTQEDLDHDRIEGLKSQYAQQIDQAIPKFFKDRNIEATPEAIVYAIENVIAHAEMHGEELDLEEALTSATERFDGLLSKHVAKLQADALLKLLTPEQIDAIRKHQLSALYEQNPLRQKADLKAVSNSPRIKGQKMRTDDFFKNIIDKRYE